MTVPLYSLTDTWNNAGTVFTAIQMNVTNTASQATSLLADFQVGGSSIFSVGIANNQTNPALRLGGDVNTGWYRFTTNTWAFAFGASVVIGIGSTSGGSSNYGLELISPAELSWASTNNLSGTNDLVLARDAAGILAQRNLTNAQTFRLYNTFTDASNYERGVFDWTTTANVLTIGVQAAGTGTASRNIVLFTGGVSIANFSVTLTSLGQNSLNITHSSGNTILQTNSAVLGWSDTAISRPAAANFAFGNGAANDSSATFVAKTKAGAPVAGDIPAGSWQLIRDTSGATTKIYYNNAGTLMSVALV